MEQPARRSGNLQALPITKIQTQYRSGAGRTAFHKFAASPIADLRLSKRFV